MGLFLAKGFAAALVPDQAPLNVTFTPAQLQGQSYIWQIAETSGGQFIASGEKVGFYDKNRWQFLEIPSPRAIRCLLVDGDTLWIARAGEIGRLQLPLTARSTYMSLALPELKDSGEIWQLMKSGPRLIAAGNDRIWFVDTASLRVKPVELPGKHRLALMEDNHRLLVAQAGVALWEIKGEELVPFENPLPDQADSNWSWFHEPYVLTAHSFYRRIDGRFQRIADLKTVNQSVSTGETQWGESIAISTFGKGLVLLNPDTGELTTISHLVSSPSFAATALFADSRGRLWVGHSKGLTLFEKPNYGHQIPADHPILAKRSQGLLISFEDRAEYYEESQPMAKHAPVFSASETPYGLALGLWGKLQVNEKTFPTAGNRTSTIANLKNGKLLAATGTRIFQIDYVAGSVEQVGVLPAEPSTFTVDDDTLWVGTVDRSLYRSPATPPLSFSKAGELPEAYASDMRSLNHTLIFKTNEQIRYGPNFSPVEGTGTLKTPLLAKLGDSLWLTGEQDGVQRLGQIIDDHGTLRWAIVEAKGLPTLTDVHYFSANEGVLTFTSDTSILELNVSELKPALRPAPPQLSFTLRDARKGSSLALSQLAGEFPAGTNSLAFTRVPTFDEFGEKPGFERRLLPNETEWTSSKNDDVVNYPSLSSRTYTLEVRATHLGLAGAHTAYTFTILPPWYASKAAVAGYILLGIAISYLTYRLRARQIIRRNQELEVLIQDRTRDLAKASAAKTEFLASMSHEIRNPMNGVVGLVNILRDQSAGNPRQLHTLKMLANCADQLRSTVDDILDFSKIEAGEVRLDSVTFNVRDTLESSAATVDPSGAAIHFLDPPPGDLLLAGDAAKLRQIYANYLSNALKYGVPPEARVHTILTPVSGQGVKLTLSVTSSGPTIDKDTLDKFFESFTRGEEAKERNIRGTGLGLAICRRYARAMGGEVGAVSTNGETTFYLTVPFQVVGHEAPLALDPLPAPISNLPAKALAIEDEDYNRIVLGSILAKMNYTVDWATTGQEALKLARENGYDIILTDYRLPDTNGVDLTKEILRICPVPKPAVFAVTAYSTRERRQECLNAGMSGFISKPITLEKLRSTLANWGEKNLAKLSLETSRPHPHVLARPPAAIELAWTELKLTAQSDRKHAAALAHRLNNLCRVEYFLDLAEQLELLEGALERQEPIENFVTSIERLLAPKPERV